MAGNGGRPAPTGRGGGGDGASTSNRPSGSSATSRPSPSAAHPGASSSTEEEPETSVQKCQRMNQDSMPFPSLTRTMMQVIKETTAKEIFPYSKFCMTEEDANHGYVQLCFIRAKWDKSDWASIARRARTWKQVSLTIVKQCADRRSRTLSAIKKACMGTSVVCHVALGVTRNLLTLGVGRTSL